MEGMSRETLDSDVLPLLGMDAQAEVRSVAMQMLLGLTGTKEGVSFITSGGDQYLRAIALIAQKDQPGIAKDAICALINLSTDEQLSWRILNLSSPHEQLRLFLLQYILSPDSPYADMVCSLLSNLTRSERCSQVFVDLMVEEKETVGFDKVIAAFCQQGFNPNNSLHYIGAFLSNLTQIPVARSYVLDHERCVIQRLLAFTEFSGSVIRRGGIVGVLRNCCFETVHHEWLLSDAVNILPRLLLPLAGPEEFDEEDNDRLPEDLQYLEPDKQREPDPDIRKMLVEAVNLLCATKTCRLMIKEKNTYAIMHRLFQWETDPSTKLAVEKMIGLLIGDEPQPGMEELHNVDIPVDIQETLEKALEQEQKEVEEELKVQNQETQPQEEAQTQGTDR